VPPDRRINRAYVHSVLKPLLPSLLLGIAAATSLADALALIARHTFRHRLGISKQRKIRSKPHKSMTQNLAERSPFLNLGGLGWYLDVVMNTAICEQLCQQFSARARCQLAKV
jgi:hypothetical protein